MKNAIITVGLGFGDEGKGATVDFLTRKLGAELVVRYSGGAQAGHNVQLLSGERHTFAQFGAGTLAGAGTFLGPRMIVCPATLKPEAEHLKQLGVANPYSLMTIHPDCLLTTSYHMAMNRLREIDRGAAKHGSCGLGIGEARSYWLRHGVDSVVAADVHDRDLLVSKLTVLRDRMLIEMQNLGTVDRGLAKEIYDSRPANEADLLIENLGHVALNRRLPDADTVIFEAAQGILLDEYYGFHPHTTWSNVTTLHADELVEQNDFDNVTTLGITRAYSTRHGAGPFPTYCMDLTAAINDRGNPTNDWQGTIQSGPLDMVLLDYAARTCKLDAVVVNNLDELPDKPTICRRYESTDRIELPVSMKEQEAMTKLLKTSRPVIESLSREDVLDSIGRLAPVIAIGEGPTHKDKMLWDEQLAVCGKPSLSVSTA